MKQEKMNKLIEYYHEKKMAHVYLIETNNIDKCYNDLLIVIKNIICENEYKDKCRKCNLCSLVDQGFLPSLYVIEPDGTNIKKEQVIELKRIFRTKPIYTKENIYIIKGADALNNASANTILKFVEEPEDNIIGFLITNNINNVIDTIRSRCEILKVNYDKDALNINNLDEYKEYLEVINKYLGVIEVEKNKRIMYNRDVILSVYDNRDDIKVLFKIILIIYQELLNKILGLDNKFEIFNMNYLDKLSKDGVIRRINLVIEVIDDIECNANIELLLDRFVIELGDVDE